MVLLFSKFFVESSGPFLNVIAICLDWLTPATSSAAPIACSVILNSKFIYHNKGYSEKSLIDGDILSQTSLLERLKGE